jgi:hypothetical protein
MPEQGEILPCSACPVIWTLIHVIGKTGDFIALGIHDYRGPIFLLDLVFVKVLVDAGQCLVSKE